MALSQITAKFGHNNTYATSSSGSFSSTPVAGSTVIVVGYANVGSTAAPLSVTDNQGNGTYTFVEGPFMAGNNSRCWIAYKHDVLSSGTFTITAASSGSGPRSMEFVLLEVPNADVSGGIDQTVIGSITTGVAYSLSTPTDNLTASALCVSVMVIQAGGNVASPALTTAPSGYTNILDSNAYGSLEVTAAYRYAGAAAVETVTYPDYFAGDGYNHSGLLLTFKTSGGSPTVSTVSSNSANEGTSIVHTVTLSAATTVAEVYAITLAGGTATGGGTDYTNTLTNGMFSNSVTVSGGNITVPIGVSSFTVTIPTTTDALVEGAETYTLTIGGTAGTGTINDLVVFTVNSVDLGSFTGFATFTVTASGTSGVDRDIVCTTSNGTAAAGVDYTATTQTVTILAGNLTADFLVPIINTRKPDTDLVTTGWTVTGAANHSAALADNTDTSYTTSPDVTASPGPLKTQMLPTPLAAGTHTRQIRANYTTTPCDVKMSLLNSSDVVQGDSGWVSLTASIADYTLSITTTGSSTRFLFEVRATP